MSLVRLSQVKLVRLGFQTVKKKGCATGMSRKKVAQMGCRAVQMSHRLNVAQMG